jgi:mono/diheme cytochrome c family protein
MRLKLVTSGLMLLCVAAWACGDDDDTKADGGKKDAGEHDDHDQDSGTDKPDSGKPQTPAERGKYLVESMGACGDCHTPRLPTGAFDTSKTLAGVDCFIDADPTKDDFGCLSSRNLTNDETGLKNRTDQEIKDMFMKGERPDGKFLQPVMPYYVLGNMSDDDADAIVAFLRTVKAVDHMVKANQAPFLPPDAAAPVVPTDKLPKPSASYKDQAAAKRGMYLAANFGVCMECHTPRDEMGSFLVDKLFEGNNKFGRDELGLPPAFPEAIYSANITPHETGIKGWSVDDIVGAIKKGVDKDKKPLCPPMPSGPMGAFGGITDADARDIANYLLSIPAKDNKLAGECDVPMMMSMPEDGGI